MRLAPTETRWPAGGGAHDGNPPHPAAFARTEAKRLSPTQVSGKATPGFQRFRFTEKVCLTAEIQTWIWPHRAL